MWVTPGSVAPFNRRTRRPTQEPTSPAWRAWVTLAWCSPWRPHALPSFTPHWNRLLQWVGYSSRVWELLCVLVGPAVMVPLSSGKGCARILWRLWAASLCPGGCGCGGSPPGGCWVQVVCGWCLHFCCYPKPPVSSAKTLCWNFIPTCSVSFLCPHFHTVIVLFLEPKVIILFHGYLSTSLTIPHVR